MTKIIDLLCNNSENSYSFKKSGDVYNIENTNEFLGAEITADGEITYFVTGCYNSGSDWMEIPLQALSDMKQICEALAEQIKKG